MKVILVRLFPLLVVVVVAFVIAPVLVKAWDYWGVVVSVGLGYFLPKLIELFSGILKIGD